MAFKDPIARTLADVRKSAVHSQYIAWCGAHHTSTNMPWDNIYPWYTPAPGPNTPAVRNAGHFLPYHAYVPDLYKDPNGTISYAPASCRRDRYHPHEPLTNPYSAPSFKRGDLIWISLRSRKPP